MQALTSTLPVSFDTAMDAARAGAVAEPVARALIRAREGRELDALLEIAASNRDRFTGRVITYSKKVFIPLTNLCRDYCDYCTFRKDPAQAGARTMTPD
ncbi:MAG TPA: 7,8-didemethyl-8-hydroxy-5-deazariboflavin synthase subunit CofG, partial [Blastocatellia bacterium]|nr:7,8-didemethyl-8-hydroxy-5-deazariboflavin synthase subunit CofG [Blastocatellia bacterium]